MKIITTMNVDATWVLNLKHGLSMNGYLWQTVLFLGR